MCVGDWNRGKTSGKGKFSWPWATYESEWKRGNHYIGQWSSGYMNGNGTMIWSNGNRYDGFWEDGLPKGNGTFRRADGSPM